MRWLIWLLWDPLAALDLLDDLGKPDHAKVMGLFAFLAIYVTIFLNKLPPLGHTVVLGSLAFGWIGWRAFLKSRVVRSRDEQATHSYPYGPPTVHMEDSDMDDERDGDR
jgi:hypothetical protein